MPDLEVPSGESHRDALAQYLLCEYHKEIAEYYGIIDNPSVPLAYEEEIKRFMNEIDPIGHNNQDLFNLQLLNCIF